MGVVESLTLTVLGGSGLVTVLVSTAGPSLTDTWAMFSTFVTAVSLTVALNVTVTVAPAATLSKVQVTMPFKLPPSLSALTNVVPVGTGSVMTTFWAESVVLVYSTL